MSKINIPVTALLYITMSGAIAAINEEKKIMNIPNYKYQQSTGTQSIVNFEIADRHEDAFYNVEEEKIKGFEQLSGTEDAPSKLSINYSISIIKSFKDIGIKPYSISLMPDGGITFEFFTPYYNAIEVYNDGEIVYLKRPDGVNDLIQSLNIEMVKNQIREINTYGDC